MKKKLNAIDLFSGCGGAALGLHEFCNVVAYCEKDKECRRVLEKNQKCGKLDVAPIYADVRNFPCLKRDIDIVSAGFPCQDISTFGNKHGLEGERSSLFHCAMKVVHDHKPNYVFLENVYNILVMPEVWKIVLKELDSEGYDCSWTIVSASNVGAPHQRRRWFLLGIRRGFEHGRKKSGLQLIDDCMWNSHGWQTNPKRKWEVNLPRLVNAEPCDIKSRLFQCGNICVPQQAWAAFLILSMGLDGQRIKASMKSEHMPNSGFFSKGKLTEIETEPLQEAENLYLEFKQYERPPGKERGERTVLPEITDPIIRPRFTTPRALGGNGPAWTLTKRSIQDIANQFRYEKNTPKSHRWRRYPNPEYIEWMVGLPRGWTEVC